MTRLAFGIYGMGAGQVSGHFINDVGASLEEAADWIIARTERACGFSRFDGEGWTAQLWQDGAVAYAVTFIGHEHQRRMPPLRLS